jgi:hypothetical protein
LDDNRHESADCVGETEQTLLILYGNKQYKEVTKQTGMDMIHAGEEWLAKSENQEKIHYRQPEKPLPKTFIDENENHVHGGPKVVRHIRALIQDEDKQPKDGQQQEEDERQRVYEQNIHAIVRVQITKKER